MKNSFLLLDAIIEEFNLKNDAAAAKFLKMPPSALSKWRGGSKPVTAAQILQIYDITGWPIDEIRRLLR